MRSVAQVHQYLATVCCVFLQATAWADGYVKVSAQGGMAEISINGRIVGSVGTIPALFEVAAGTHSVRAERPGYSPRQITLDVGDGQVVTVHPFVFEGVPSGGPTVSVTDELDKERLRLERDQLEAERRLNEERLRLQREKQEADERFRQQELAEKKRQADNAQLVEGFKMLQDAAETAAQSANTYHHFYPTPSAYPAIRYEIKPKYYDLVPNDGINDPGSTMNPIVIERR